MSTAGPIEGIDDADSITRISILCKLESSVALLHTSLLQKLLVAFFTAIAGFFHHAIKPSFLKGFLELVSGMVQEGNGAGRERHVTYREAFLVFLEDLGTVFV